MSQSVFKDPVFVAILQTVHGPYETKGIVPKPSTKAFKGFMNVEFEVTCPSLKDALPYFAADVYVRVHGGVHVLDDDEDDE